MASNKLGGSKQQLQDFAGDFQRFMNEQANDRETIRGRGSGDMFTSQEVQSTISHT